MISYGCSSMVERRSDQSEVTREADDHRLSWFESRHPYFSHGRSLVAESRSDKPGSVRRGLDHLFVVRFPPSVLFSRGGSSVVERWSDTPEVGGSIPHPPHRFKSSFQGSRLVPALARYLRAPAGHMQSSSVVEHRSYLAATRGSTPLLCSRFTREVAQLVEHRSYLAAIRGSIPLPHTCFPTREVAQLVEQRPYKAQIRGSIPLPHTYLASEVA
jgi:hypothetical protein